MRTVSGVSKRCSGRDAEGYIPVPGTMAQKLKKPEVVRAVGPAGWSRAERFACQVTNISGMKDWVSSKVEQKN